VKAEDWVRLGLAFALFGLLAIEVIAALWVVVVCCNQSTATPTPAVENLKSILTLVLSPTVALFGAVTGFYYGTKSETKNPP